MDLIFARARELDTSDPADFLNAMKTYMEAQPDVVEAGLGPDMAYCYFADGEPIAVLTEPRGEATTAGRARDTGTASSPAPVQARGVAARSTLGMELPGSHRAVVMNAFEQGEFGSYQAAGPQVKQLLEGAGYEVASNNGSVADYKALDQYGVVYVDAHGTVLPGGGKVTGSDSPLNRNVFLLETSDLVPLDAQNHIDLEQERQRWGDEVKVGADGSPPALMRALALANRFTQQSKVHYYITPTFLKRYGKPFPDNSLVFLNVCRGMEPVGLEFANTLNGLNASVIGWTNSLQDGDAYARGILLVDRLLGANSSMTQRESPPQRPFDGSAVLEWMAGLPVLHPSLFRSKETVELVGQTPGSTAFGILAPSIEHIDVVSQRQIRLYGVFGSFREGECKVTLDGQELTVAPGNWNSSSISAQGEGGQLRPGKVQVEVRKIKSNEVPLTLRVTTEVKYNPEQDTHSSDVDGSFGGHTHEHTESQVYWTGKVGVLLDEHGYREKPGGPVLARSGQFAASVHFNIEQVFYRVTRTLSGGASPTNTEDYALAPSVPIPLEGVSTVRPANGGYQAILQATVVGGLKVWFDGQENQPSYQNLILGTSGIVQMDTETGSLTGEYTEPGNVWPTEFKPVNPAPLPIDNGIPH